MWLKWQRSGKDIAIWDYYINTGNLEKSEYLLIIGLVQRVAKGYHDKELQV